MVRAWLNPILPPIIEEAIHEALRKLLFVEAIINSTLMKTLVDLGATHNFLSEKEAHCLGLSWLDFFMLRIDDFNVILGVDFMTKAKAKIFLHFMAY
ncbi:unnamed protein product [Spirodela intermedia]|uniref:Uncharacterized protein n=1 Tax=Spirodela intermedia TaxID=51605 RepID=A0A7I8K099_SPIIN|nr:unnamed protein product [Spirodela intermedia]